MYWILKIQCAFQNVLSEILKEVQDNIKIKDQNYTKIPELYDKIS